MKTALITGVTGQDGYFLSKYLLDKGYRVVGMARHIDAQLSPESAGRRVELIRGDLTQAAQVAAVLELVQPHEIYNLAAFSKPYASRGCPDAVMAINGHGARSLFNLARAICPHARIFQASSSEMFGKPSAHQQNEQSLLAALNPYAAAKIHAHRVADDFRARYGQFIACGILFSHESELRSRYYAVQKIAHGAACVRLGLRESPFKNEIGRPIVIDAKLHMGNLNVSRDWGYAGDYVEAIWKIMQHPAADDFIIGTGIPHTLKCLCKMAYGIVGRHWQDYVVSDSDLCRGAEAHKILADPAKIAATLGWQASTSMHAMLAKMIDRQAAELLTALALPHLSPQT